MEARRVEYKRLTDRLKATIAEKDKDYLHQLIHCPISTKRLLMKELLTEHRENVSKELAKLRFNRSSNPVMDSMEKQTETLSHMNLDRIPDEVMKQVENLAKECHNVVQDDDIVEVPVPPKPPPLLIRLDDDGVGHVESQNQGQNGDQNVSQSDDKSEGQIESQNRAENEVQNRNETPNPVQNVVQKSQTPEAGSNKDSFMELIEELESLNKESEDLRKKLEEVDQKREKIINRLKVLHSDKS